MKKLLLILLLLPLLSFAWWDATWGYRQQAIINHTSPSELTNFPVYVSIDTQALISAAKMQGDCDDLRVINTSDDSVLPYEIETGTCNTTATIVWFLLPTAAADTNFTAYVYYGKGAAADGQNKTGVWTNGYQDVWHLSEADAKDSTDANNCTAYNTPTISASKFGNGLDLDGVNEYLDCGNVDAIENGTLSWFMKNKGTDGVGYVIARNPSEDAWGAFGVVTYESSTMKFPYNDGTNQGGISLLSYANTDSDTFYAITWYNGSNATIYENGSVVATAASLGCVNCRATSNTSIGRAGEYANYYFGGALDELRISTVRRSADWISAEVKQTYSLGSEDNETNYAPVIDPDPVTISHKPTALYNQSLTCSYTVTDADSDLMDVVTNWYTVNMLFEYTLKWQENHTNVASGTNISDMLYYGNLTVGDIWACNGTATDGTVTTESMGSSQVTIVNRTITLAAADTDLNETEDGNITATLHAVDGWIGDYNITVYYNNTLILNVSETAPALTATVVKKAPYTAPLVASDTAIAYNVSMEAVTTDGNHSTANTSGTNTAYAYYNDSFTLTKAATYTLEAKNNFTVAVLARPAKASADANVSYTYSLAACQLHYANGTEVNATCGGSISAANITTFSILPSHRKTDGVIYESKWLNRTYALSFSKGPESTSSKTLDDLQNASLEYFVWITDYANGTINGTANISTIMNASFVLEETLAATNASSAVLSYSAYFSDGYQKNFTLAFSGALENVTVNAYPDAYVANLSSFEQYLKAGYTTRTRFLTYASTVLDTKQDVTIYFLSNANASYALIYVIDNGESVGGATVRIMKYYPESSAYVVVDEQMTNSGGLATTYIDAEAYYKFTVFDGGGTQLYTSVGPEKFDCSGTCQITLNIGTGGTIDYVSPYKTANCRGNNATNSIIFDYSDVTGLTENVTFLAYRENVAAPVCNYTTSGASASYVCTLGGSENLTKYLYSCEVWHQASPSFLDYVALIDFRTITAAADWLFAALCFVVVLGVAALHAGIGVGLAGISLFALSAMGIVDIPVGTTIPIMFVGFVVAYMLFRRGDS